MTAASLELIKQFTTVAAEIEVEANVSRLFWLTDELWMTIEPYWPGPHRVGDRASLVIGKCDAAKWRVLTGCSPFSVFAKALTPSD